jgi:hypothetical protein
VPAATAIFSGTAGHDFEAREKRMQKSSILFMAVTAASLTLAGCGGGNAGTADAAGSGGESAAPVEVADLDPCSLLTAEEVAAITTDKVNRTNRDKATCYYHSTPGEEVRVTVMKTGGAKQMEVVHRTANVLGGMGASVADKGGAGADAAELLKKDKSATPKIGDESAWGAVSMLSVRKGDMFVEVTPLMMHDPANHSGYPLVGTEEKRKIAVAIAEKVLAKLQ